MNTIDNSRQELVLLKLHGSIDWFDRTSYDDRVRVAQASPQPYEPKHPLFGPDRITDLMPLVDGPRSEEDPLVQIFRVPNLAPILRRGFWECAPVVLSPSSMKLFYSQPIRDFWWGLQGAGGLNLMVGIVGYSLPPYDAYARQALYHIVDNYQGYEPDLTLSGRTKTKLRLLDYRPEPSSIQELKERYRFVDWERADLWHGGFTDSAVDWLLQ